MTFAMVARVGSREKARCDRTARQCCGRFGHSFDPRRSEAGKNTGGEPRCRRRPRCPHSSVGVGSGRHRPDRSFSRNPMHWMDEPRGPCASLRPTAFCGEIPSHPERRRGSAGVTESLSRTRSFSPHILIADRGATIRRCRARSRSRTTWSRDVSRQSCMEVISSLLFLQIPVHGPSPRRRFWTRSTSQHPSWLRKRLRSLSSSGSNSPREEPRPRAVLPGSCPSWRRTPTRASQSGLSQRLFPRTAATVPLSDGAAEHPRVRATRRDSCRRD